MELSVIPKTELKVSPLCLGTMMFGNPVEESSATRLVHWALDAGINFMDTADMYEGYNRFLGSPGGISEEFLGKALRNRRHDSVITTKVGNPVGDQEYQGTGLGNSHILHQIDQSLRRLQTDYVDIYEMHIADPDTPIEESIAVMDQLIDQGKVRYWGFSNFSASQIHKIVTLCDSNGWRRPVAYFSCLFAIMASLQRQGSVRPCKLTQDKSLYLTGGRSWQSIYEFDGTGIFVGSDRRFNVILQSLY